MPYDFYTVLRVVALVVFSWGARVLLRRDSTAQAAVFAVLAVLFNPFFPIHLSRGTWAIVDVGGAIALLAWAGRMGRAGSASEAGSK
jgi:hypothetical protein